MAAATAQSLYQYVASNSSGEIVKGKLTAGSEEAVSQLLEYAGYRPISIKPFVPFFSPGKLSMRRPVKPAELVVFYRQLALLLETGMDIVTSLELLKSQSSNRSISRVLAEVIADLRGGSQLSASLSKHPDLFPPICCQSLKVGEHIGSVEVMLKQVADYVEKAAATAKSLKGALTMPIVTAVIAVLVIGILMTVVLPAFGGLYGSLGVKLPALLKMLLAVSAALKDYGLYLGLGGMVAGVGGMAYVRTPQGRLKLDMLLLRLPVLGKVNHLTQLARCCRSLSLLYRAGLPLTDIMPLIIKSCDNQVMIKALTDVQQEMLQGEGLSQPMSRNELFLPMMVRMVRVGEETGNLDATLLAVAQYYEIDAEDRTRSLIGLIQPAMTLVIGGVVGVITLSLISAIYSIYGEAF